MIILVHFLSIIIFQLLRSRKRIKFWQRVQESKTIMEDNCTNILDVRYNLKFDPPLYRQRYGRVYETLLDEKWRRKIKKLVDFGCSDFKIFVFLKRLSSLNDIFFVDINECLLKRHAIKLQPLTVEYLKRREEPLNVSVFAGSVGDPDYHLLDTDAVTAVELIEHLYPDVLDAFPYNIFNFIEPKLVIITTPNSDFNVLFGNKSQKFRNSDHKFEWSREQFESWATNITVRFPDYSVSFSGMGEGPEGTEHFGLCTQMAVFIRKDVLDNGYVSKAFTVSCLCGINSKCKGLTAASKMLCNCVCPLCSPSASYGVCTYYSCSKQIINYEIDDDEEQNPSYNIFYKFIEKIQYPFERDLRTEEEKMMDEFKYRIHMFGQVNGRFFVEERNRSEIPLQDILYGPDGVSITQSELRKLLTKHNYQVEECRIQETGLIENCVIYEPVMEEISSTSEASGYDSDFTKYHLNEGSISDWDEPYGSTGKKKSSDTSKTNTDMTCLEVALPDSPPELPNEMEDDKKQQDSLFDSGYQKSLSLLDDSPQTPLEDLEETDLFDDATSTPSLSSEDNKVHLKRATTIEKQSFIPIPPDFGKLKLDVNRINELDKFNNIPPGRTIHSHHLKPPHEVFKKTFLKEKEPLPGPSNVQPKKRKKLKKLPTDGEDESPLEDVKSITNCIIENTLNKIDVDEENDEKNGLIEYAAEQALEPGLPAVVVNEAPLELAVIVENGDLANNNRDIEGNNYIAQEEAVDIVGNDIANDNFEIIELPHIHEENANFNNNNGHLDALQVIQDPPLMFDEPNNVENAEIIRPNDEVAGGASREALFDPNSEQDSLTDFVTPQSMQDSNIVDMLNVNGIVVIGVHPHDPDDPDTGIPVDYNGFPDWLLQILGSQNMLEEVTPPGSQEEPHFYCQGDGLGVHPSVIAVEIDDDDESSDSSNNSTEFAEVDQGLSSQDMSSLPEDSVVNPLEMQDVLLETDTEETEEAGVGPTTSEQGGLAGSSPGSDKGTT